MKENVKNRNLTYKSVYSNVKDIDDSGIVIFYAAVFGNLDRAGDIIEKGAFIKTISENFKEIQHYKNHFRDEMPGVIQSFEEDNFGLKATSKLILDTQAGKETLAQYKAMAEAGKSMKHSIGYVTIREEKMADGNHLKEIFLHEVSTLTARPANPLAGTIDIKSLDGLDFDELIKEEIFYTNLLNCKFTDAKLENLEKIKIHISALIDESRRKNAPDPKDAPLTKEGALIILRS